MNDVMAKQSRNLSMDVAKAMVICLIVLGHSFSEDSTSKIRSFLYLFHVPFFFIVSGYFFNEKYIHKPIELIFRRIKSLWVPFFSWAIPFIIFHNFFFAIYVYSSQVTFRGHSIPHYSILAMAKNIAMLFLFKASEQLLGAFWFLQCLFFSVAIFLTLSWLLNKVSLSRLLPLFTVALFVAGNAMFSFNIHFPFVPYDVRLFFVATFLYHIGFLYRKYEKSIPVRFLPMLVSLLILLAINAADFVKIDSIYSVTGLSYKSVLYLVATPILGTYVVIYVSQYISRFSISKYFNFIGNQTIAILALHFLCFKLVSLLIVHKDNLPLYKIAEFPVIANDGWWFLAYSAVGIAVPIMVYIPFLKSKEFAINAFLKLINRGACRAFQNIMRFGRH
ncbi:MAG: acyltransferase family protein [Nitrospina sp.]|jgi:fucose 4-O-acetylase-like acetyltransferase|nr:acyltransferase family protein [Nitrospina sp.]